jgi:cell division protein FtsW (lipid II flippase)
MKALWNKIKNWMNTDNHLLWVSIIALIGLGLCGMFFIGPYEMGRYHMTQWWSKNMFFDKFWPFVLAGIIILFAFSKLSKKWIIRISWILGIFAFLLMLLTIFYPVYIHGASRYAFIFGTPISPYMVMLPPYIVLMSHWLSKDKANKKWITIGTTALTLFIVLAAINAPYIFMAQVYMLLFIVMTFMARKNVPSAFCLGIGTLIVFAALMVLAAFTMPHVQMRLMHLFDGNLVYHTQGWWAVHALTHSTFIGNTPESLTALKVLPGSIDDFMFTSMIAKFGYLVGLLILGLYGCIAKGLINLIRNTKDRFAKMLATGILGMFAIFVFMALAVAFGLLKTAAYWPLISFGGTMLLVWCVSFGFVIAGNRE